ncbi:hypothetical protein CHS0354_036151 [Potamilus streckersoni]|uniref:Uncharacterized protein n=1 Tax=Potamilus streckersoni TaxID=2493646 RepID=A0AAE0T438_9BIVA|nr:hypothetical protein CHS0354_036151 [Potamilus streckersoni]
MLDRPDLRNEEDDTFVSTEFATIQSDLGPKVDLDKSSDVKEYSAETLNESIADELTNVRESKDKGEVIYIRHASVLGGKSIPTLDELVNCTYKDHMKVHGKDKASVQGDRPHNVIHNGQEVQDSKNCNTETFNTRTRATGEENLGLNTESSEGDDKELFETSTVESPKCLQNHVAFDNAENSVHQMLSSTDFVPGLNAQVGQDHQHFWQKGHDCDHQKKLLMRLFIKSFMWHHQHVLWRKKIVTQTKSVSVYRFR